MFFKNKVAALSGLMCGSFNDYVESAPESEKEETASKFRGVEILDHSKEFQKLGDCYTKPVEKSAPIFREVANGLDDVRAGKNTSVAAIVSSGWVRSDVRPMSKTELMSLDKRLALNGSYADDSADNISTAELLRLRFRLHAAEVALAVKMGADPAQLD